MRHWLKILSMLLLSIIILSLSYVVLVDVILVVPSNQSQSEHRTPALPKTDLAGKKNDLVEQYLTKRDYSAALEALSLRGDLASQSALQESGVFDWPTKPTGKRHSQCTKTIEFIADRWQSYQSLLQLYEAITNNQHIKQLAPCLIKPVLIPKSAHCITQPRIECDAAILLRYLQYDNSYLVVMHDSGKANINAGVMYLPAKAPLRLFLHEFMHWYGFADEYRLRGEFSQLRCDSDYAKSYPNIISASQIPLDPSLDDLEIRQQILAKLSWAEHIKDSTELFQREGSDIVIGTPDKSRVGLFPTRICQDNLIYKPVADMTAMEFYELDMPTLYWQLAQKISASRHVEFASQSLLARSENKPSS